MTPPPPPPPPPPSFFQSYHRPSPKCDKFHHRSGSSQPHSEFDSSKLPKLQKCSNVEYQKQKMNNKYSNGDLRRSNRPRSSHKYNFSPSKDSIHDGTSSCPNNHPNAVHMKPKIYTQNYDGHHHSSKYQQRSTSVIPHHPSSGSFLRQKSDQSEISDYKFNSTTNFHKNEHLSIFDVSKKSRCILFSQIYLITHVSITICLNKTRDIQTSIAGTSISKNIMTDVYLLYILIGALIFFALLRYYAIPRFTDNLTFNELTQQTPILFGAIILGFSELAQCVMELIDCVESDSVIIPAVKFAYHIAFMHFLLTQITYSDYIGLRNIAIAHLLSTQLSLWILSANAKRDNLQTTRHCCHKLDLGTLRMFLFNDNSTKNDVLEFNDDYGTNSLENNNSLFPDPFQISLYVLNNQFKFLSVFILITMWFSNNQSKINFIRAKLSEEEVIRTAYMNPVKKLYLFRGFVIGSIFLMTAVVSIIFYDNRIFQYSSSIFIQVMIAIIALVGLIVRRRQIDSNDPKYQINILKHHFIIFVTLFLIYIVSLMNLFSHLTQLFITNKHKSEMDSHDGTNETSWMNGNGHPLLITILSAISYLSLIIQVTIQTYLLRLQGKKLVNMTHVFSLLAISNFALWMIDVSMIVSDRHLWPVQWQHPKPTQNHAVQTNSLQSNNSIIPLNDLETGQFEHSDYLRNALTMFVPLNRYYCAFIFFHFWKLKI